MARLTVVIAGTLLFALVSRLSAQVPGPDAPVPPGSKFGIIDLTFRTEPVAGDVRALQVKETATEIRIEMSADVLFDFDKAEIRPDAVEVLAQAAQELRRHQTRRAVIEGHTDSKGSDEYNQRLSERRAQAVKRWLEERERVKGMGLETRGWGAKKPVAPNTKADGSDDPGGRQKNRRVDIIIAKVSR